jgi:hypothetical protein
MSIATDAPRSVGGVLDRAMRVFGRGLGPTLPLCLAFVAVDACPYIVLSMEHGEFTVSPRGNDATQFVALTYLTAFASAIFSCALIVWYASKETAQPLRITASLHRGARLFPRLLLSGFYLGLVLMLAAVPLYVIYAMSQSSFTSDPKMVGAVEIVLFCVALLYGAIRLWPLTAVLAVDDCSALDGILESWRLTKGHWWRSAGVATIVSMFYFIFAMLLGFLLAAISGVFGTLRGLQSELQFILTLIRPWIAAWFSASVYALYLDLKSRREGQDLALQVARLSA